MNPSRSPSSSALLSATRDSDTLSIRPRNRRAASGRHDASSTTPSPSRGASPIPAARVGSVTGRNNSSHEVAASPSRKKSSAVGRGGLLESGWSGWASSIQDLASALVSNTELLLGTDTQQPRSRDTSRARNGSRQGRREGSSKSAEWGPEPPGGERRPRPEDIAARSNAKREAALKAMRTASVLESYDGVNGGLDVSGRFKKRSSDEDLRGTAQNDEPGEHLVYIHHVQPTDTYAGIVLKYRCREDVFRRANGLWSQNNVQVRKWLAVPVDACEVKGRPCEAPSHASANVDLLAPTPSVSSPLNGDGQDGFFGPSSNGHALQRSKSHDDDRPWTHVRWVSIDSCPQPVEVARVPRKMLGYFPPRRKKSIHTTSTMSTPRGSVDVPSLSLDAQAAGDSPKSGSSRRLSVLSAGRPHQGPSSAPSLSRVNSSTGDDLTSVPAWMRRPGGVGSLNRNVRAPGPETDYFNTIARRIIPGLEFDSMPSMSVMGSESARFGFTKTEPGASAGIAESPFGEGHDAAGASRHASANGLDKAAAAIETWLRGALEKAKLPGTPVLGPRGRPGSSAGAGPSANSASDAMMGDLIELEDTGSEDGRGARQQRDTWDGGVFGGVSGGGATSGRNAAGLASVRGRGGSKKAD